jgi:hypothetical protein
MAQASTVPTAARARPSASSSRLACGMRAYMMTLQTSPDVTATATRAVGIVNQASSALQTRSPATSSNPQSTTITTIVVSTTSTDTAREPDRARIMAMPAAPNSTTHGTTATTASRSTAGESATVVSSNPAPSR